MVWQYLTVNFISIFVWHETALPECSVWAWHSWMAHRTALQQGVALEGASYSGTGKHCLHTSQSLRATTKLLFED